MEDNNPMIPFEPQAQHEPKSKSPTRSRPPRRRSSITPKNVEDILAWRDRLNGIEDGVRRVIGVAMRSDEEPALLAALVNGSDVTKAIAAIDREIELITSDDLHAGIELGSESKDDRRRHWELASGVDPDKAREINDGSTDYPASKDSFSEIEKVRRLQKQAAGYEQTLRDASAFLS